MDHSQNKVVITHESGYTYQHSLLSISETKKIIEENNGVKLELFTDHKFDSGREVFLLDNNGIVVKYFDDGESFSSIEGFLLEHQYSFKDRKEIPTEYPIKRILPTSDFSSISYQEINLDQAEEKVIFILNRISINPKTKKPIYYLNTGEIIIPWSETIYKLYQNQKEFDYCQNYFFEKRNRPVLFGLNPYGEKFPNHVEELISRLPNIIDITLEDLDYSRASFRKLTKALYKNIIDDELKMKAFLPLLTYIGKCAVKRFDDEFIMDYDEAFDTWIPELKSQKGMATNEKYYYKLNLILDSFDSTFLPLMTATTKQIQMELK